jgi:hypothetical protein
MELAKVLKGGTRVSRLHKETGMRGDDMSELTAWKVQAAAVGYRHESAPANVEDGSASATLNDAITTGSPPLQQFANLLAEQPASFGNEIRELVECQKR